MKNLLRFALLLSVLVFPNLILAQNGLKAEFYDGVNFNKLVGTRIDSNIDFYWNERPPVPGMDPNLCSARWTGMLKTPKTGVYTFSARVDDGIRVWIADELVIDNWRLNDVGFSKGEIKLEAGEFYDLKVEYFNALIEAEIKLLWKLPIPDNQGWFDWFFTNSDPYVIPTDYFFQPKPEKIAITEEEDVVVPPPPKKKVERTIPQEPNDKIITAPPLPALMKLKKDTLQKYIPKSVQFERAKTEILSVSFGELNDLADFLNRNPHHKVIVEGHTDNVGDSQKNFSLSQRRANAVAAYLIKKGVNHKRLEAKGFGGSKPLAQSDGRKYHPENRRVEFIIY